MRYEFVGRKVPYAGKTLWEILGNLKNFGVGRLVKKNPGTVPPELSFLKIIKVQPIPPPKNEFEDRNVIVWVEEFYKDRKLGISKTLSSNNLPMYHLISKDDEKKYLETLQNVEPPVENVMKYCSWPPLYKKLWEKETAENKKYGSIPKLKRITTNYPGCVVVEHEEEMRPSTCSLYKGEFSVDEMYKEIVRLKLFIKDNAQA